MRDRPISRYGPLPICVGAATCFSPGVFPPSRLRALALGILGCALAAPALAQSGDERLPLGDLIEVVELEDELLAIDAEGGGTSVVKRLLGERVSWRGTRGLLAVVLTDRRVLAIGTGSSSWQEADYERGESAPERARLGDRVALVVLPQRVLGFVGTTGRFVEQRLGPHQELRAVRVGANVGVVVTDREALGLSPSGGFFSIRLQLKERIDEVSVRSNLATVHTDQRVLVFRGPSGTWAERRR